MAATKTPSGISSGLTAAIMAAGIIVLVLGVFGMVWKWGEKGAQETQIGQKEVHKDWIKHKVLHKD